MGPVTPKISGWVKRAKRWEDASMTSTEVIIHVLGDDEGL